VSARAREIGIVSVAGAWWLLLAIAFLWNRGDDVGRLPALTASFVASLARGPVWGWAGLLASLAGASLAGLIGFAWYGLGDAIARRLSPLRDRPPHDDPIAEVAGVTLLGAAAWSLIWFLLGAVYLYRVPVAMVALLAGLALAAAALARDRPSPRALPRVAGSAALALIITTQALALIAALAAGPRRRVFLYGVNTQITASALFDTTPVRALKLAAVQCFESQIAYHDLVAKGTAVDISRTVNVEDPGVVYMEGYLWDLPRAKQAMLNSAMKAKDNGVKVSLTLSDAFCVARFRDEFLELAEKYVDRPAAELPLLFQRILSNATMDWFRRQRVRNAVVQNFSDFETEAEGGDFDLLETLQVSEGTIGTESAADSVGRVQILLQIELEVSQLPQRQREAFLLRYWEELDVAETAAVMGCSEGSVKTHCSRAVHALAKALKAKGITP